MASNERVPTQIRIPTRTPTRTPTHTPISRFLNGACTCSIDRPRFLCLCNNKLSDQDSVFMHDCRLFMETNFCVKCADENCIERHTLVPCFSCGTNMCVTLNRHECYDCDPDLLNKYVISKPDNIVGIFLRQITTIVLPQGLTDVRPQGLTDVRPQGLTDVRPQGLTSADLPLRDLISLLPVEEQRNLVDVLPPEIINPEYRYRPRERYNRSKIDTTELIQKPCGYGGGGDGGGADSEPGCKEMVYVGTDCTMSLFCRNEKCNNCCHCCDTCMNYLMLSFTEQING